MNTAFIKHRLYQTNKSNIMAAEEMKVSPEYFSSLINGRTNPTKKTLDKLAKTIGCETYQLLTTEFDSSKQ